MGAPARHGRGAFLLEEPPFLETEPAVVGEDEMVAQLDLEENARQRELAREADIGLARVRVLRRMIVRDDDAVRVGEQRSLEDLPRVGERRVEAADGDELAA